MDRNSPGWRHIVQILLIRFQTYQSLIPTIYAIKAIRDFLEAEEDYLLALARLEEHNPRIPLDTIERELDG